MAQTINVANIKIGLDVDELRKNGQFTRAELNSISKLARESIDPFDKYADEMDKLARAYRAGGVSAEAFVRMQERLSQKLGVKIPTANLEAYSTGMQALRAKLEAGTMSADQFRVAQANLQRSLGAVTQSVQEQTRSIGSNANAMSQLKSMAAGYIGATAAVSGLKQAISFASEAEQTRIAFEVMTGSISTAQMLMDQFKALDVQSPINAGDFASAAKTLMQFGLAAESIPGILSSMSAISLGNTQQFQSLSLAFGQVAANGRLMGGELLQMVNAGFNPLQEISRTTGIAMVDLKKQMEAGGISADMVAKAFMTATEEGGRFAGMNERLANSIAGQYSKIEGDIKALAVEVGTELIPLLSKASEGLRQLFQTESGGEGPGVIGFNIGLISDAYTSIIGGLQKTDLSSMISPIGFVQDVVSGQNTVFGNILDSYEELKQAEQDRQDQITLSNAQEAERAKVLAEQAAIEKEAAVARKEAAEAEKKMLAGVQAEADERNKVSKEIMAMRDEYDRLVMSEEEYNRKKREAAGYTEQEMAIAEDFDRRIAAEREKKRLAQEKAPAKEAEKAIANIAPALKAGTAEAFRFLGDQQAKATQQAEQKKIQEAILEEQKKANELNRQAPRLARL